MNKPTKKQIRSMKALYTDADVDALEALINRQWNLINEGIDKNESEAVIADRIITIFGLVLNEQGKIVMTYDPHAWDRAVYESKEKQKNPDRLIFSQINAVKTDFAFGHPFHRMDTLITKTFNNIRSFMRQFPIYEEAIRTAWNASRGA